MEGSLEQLEISSDFRRCSKHSKLFGTFLWNTIPTQLHYKESWQKIDTKTIEIDLIVLKLS